MSYFKKGYSIWLFSDSQIFRKIQIINNFLSFFNLSKKFQIHLTIHGHINKNLFIRNFKNIKNFKIRIKKLKYKKDFFMNSYLEVSKNKNIKNLYFRFNKIKTRNYNFSPHISIVYSNNKYIRPFIKLFSIIFKIENNECVINKLSIIKFDETNFKWKVLKTYTLKS